MADLVKILELHQQWFPASCAASGMEIVLKLHGKVAEEWFSLQHEFQNQNIGFSQLDKLAAYGLQAQESHLPKGDFLSRLQQECAAGRFPVFSLPNLGLTRLIDGSSAGVREWHIWVGIPDGSKVTAVSKTFLRSSPLKITDLEPVIDLALSFDPNYRVHVVTYQ